MKASQPLLLLPTLILAVATFGIDTASKIWIRSWLALGESYPILGNFFKFTRGENGGLAMGIRLDPTLAMLLALSGAVLMSIFLWQRRHELLQTPAAATAVGLVSGGALGNLVDRLTDGTVTDFLDVGIGLSRWPTSNLADIAIVGGLVFLSLWTAQTPSPQTPLTPPPTAREEAA